MRSMSFLRNNRVLWVLQILLAALYLFAGGFKLIAAPEDMRATPADPIPSGNMLLFLRTIGGFEVARRTRAGSPRPYRHQTSPDADCRRLPGDHHGRRRRDQRQAAGSCDGHHAARSRHPRSDRDARTQDVG
jgi:hypothetical protein